MTTLPDDVTIRLQDMPVRQGGMIAESPDGHVNIYLNARLSHDGRLRAAHHELDHYGHGALDSDEDIRAVESRGAKKLPPLIRASELPPPKPKTRWPLTRYQTRVVLRAIRELDEIMLN